MKAFHWFVFVLIFGIFIICAATSQNTPPLPPLPVHIARSVPTNSSEEVSKLAVAKAAFEELSKAFEEQRQENARLRMGGPLPQGRRDMFYTAQMAPLNCTLLDDHLYGVHIPDGMRLTSMELKGLTFEESSDLLRTNRSATVLWLSAK